MRGGRDRRGIPHQSGEWDGLGALERGEADQFLSATGTPAHGKAERPAGWESPASLVQLAFTVPDLVPVVLLVMA